MCDPDKEVLEVCLFLMTEYRILFSILSLMGGSYVGFWVLRDHSSSL